MLCSQKFSFQILPLQKHFFKTRMKENVVNRIWILSCSFMEFRVHKFPRCSQEWMHSSSHRCFGSENPHKNAQLGEIVKKIKQNVWDTWNCLSAISKNWYQLKNELQISARICSYRFQLSRHWLELFLQINNWFPGYFKYGWIWDIVYDSSVYCKFVKKIYRDKKLFSIPFGQEKFDRVKLKIIQGRPDQ